MEENTLDSDGKVLGVMPYERVRDALETYVSTLANGVSEDPLVSDAIRRKRHDDVIAAFGFDPKSNYHRDRFFDIARHFDTDFIEYGKDVGALAKHYYCEIADAISGHNGSFDAGIATKFVVKERMHDIICGWRATFEREYAICKAEVDRSCDMIADYNRFVKETGSGKRCYRSFSHEINSANTLFNSNIARLENCAKQPLCFFTDANVKAYVSDSIKGLQSAVEKLALNSLRCRVFMEDFMNRSGDAYDFKGYDEWRKTDVAKKEEK